MRLALKCQADMAEPAQTMRWHALISCLWGESEMRPAPTEIKHKTMLEMKIATF